MVYTWRREARWNLQQTQHLHSWAHFQKVQILKAAPALHADAACQQTTIKPLSLKMMGPGAKTRAVSPARLPSWHRM